MRIPACLLLAVALPLQSARADDDCDAPVAQWQSREAVLQMAARQGWQVQRLKIDDGCYELRGRDAAGVAFKARVDPRTLAVLRIRRHEADRERHHGPAAGRQGDRHRAEAAPASAPTPAPALDAGRSGGSRATID